MKRTLLDIISFPGSSPGGMTSFPYPFYDDGEFTLGGWESYSTELPVRTDSATASLADDRKHSFGYFTGARRR